MTALSTSTISQINRLLVGAKRTTRQIAFATGIPQNGIEACLNGMWRRAEVKRSVARPGKTTVWWLP
jgi:hypothetical protein